MIDFLTGALETIVNIVVTGAIIVAVIVLAFEPLITGRRR